MKEKITKSLLKFLSSLVFFNYLVFFVARALSVPNSVFNASDSTRARIIGSIEAIYNTNFFVYYIEGITGNWGYSSYARGSVMEFTMPILEFTIVMFTITSLFSIGLTFLFVRFIVDNEPKYLTKFRGNWLLFSSILLFVVLALTIDPSMWSYGGDFDDIYTDVAIWFQAIIAIIFATGKMLSEISTFPIYSDIPNDDLEFPSADSKFTNSKESTIAPDLNPGYLTIMAFKSASVFILEILFLTGLIMRIPNLFRTLTRSFVFYDFVMVIPLIFYIILIILLTRFITDIIGYILGFDEVTYLRTHSYEQTISSTLIKKIVYIFIGITVLLMLFAAFVWSFTSFVFDPFWVFWPPFQSAPQDANLSIFSSGHILGTDRIGRDLLSIFVFGSIVFILPVVITVIVRPLIVLVVGNVPNLGDKDLSFEIFDLMEGIPKLPFLFIFAYYIYDTVYLETSNRLVTIVVMTSLLAFFFWGAIGKKFFRAIQSNRWNLSIRDKFTTIAMFSGLSIIIEILLLELNGYNILIVDGAGGWLDSINGLILPVQNPLPYLIIILLTSIFVVSYYWISHIRITGNSHD